MWSLKTYITHSPLPPTSNLVHSLLPFLVLAKASFKLLKYVAAASWERKINFQNLQSCRGHRCIIGSSMTQPYIHCIVFGMKHTMREIEGSCSAGETGIARDAIRWPVIKFPKQSIVCIIL